MKFLYLFLFTNCIMYNPSYIDKILNDFETNSYFIVFHMKTADYGGDVIVPNEGLFYYFQKEKGFSKDAYKLFVKQQLNQGALISSDTLDLFRWDFEKVVFVESVLINSRQGKNYFIEKYFNNHKVLKDGISGIERTAIISQLFKWEVLSKIDDETGCLIICK